MIEETEQDIKRIILSSVTKYWEGAIMSIKKQDGGLLEKLRIERGKYTKSNELVMKELIDKLVEVGIYPSDPTKAMKDHNYSILDMVNTWGVDWYFYDEPFECPHCKSDLRDKNGPPLKREIAISNFVLDRVVDYICPDCYRSLNSGEQYNKEEFEKANNAPLPEELLEKGE